MPISIISITEEVSCGHDKVSAGSALQAAVGYGLGNITHFFREEDSKNQRFEQLKFCDDGVIRTKTEIAIKRLQAFAPPEGYFVAFSGGKDSQCVYHLCEMAGVPFEAHYHVTGVDPPELIYFMRQHYPDVHFDIPHDKQGNRITIWSLIEQKSMPPTRIARYCCEHLKEHGGGGSVTVTGVRWAESARRRKQHSIASIAGKAKATIALADALGADYKTSVRNAVVLNDDNDPSRRMVEQCYRTQKTMVNPIVDWTDAEVWHFLDHIAKVPHCCLYDQGFARLGCIGCPMSSKQAEELERWPKYKALYLRAFERMLTRRAMAGKDNLHPRDWSTPEKVMSWWLGETEEKTEKGGIFIAG